MNTHSLIAAGRGCDARVEHLEGTGQRSLCGRDTHWSPTRHPLPICKQCRARASVMTIDEMKACLESGLSFADFRASRAAS